MDMRRISSTLVVLSLSALTALGCGDDANPTGGGPGGSIAVINPSVTSGRNRPIQVTLNATGNQTLSFSVTSNPTNGTVGAVVAQGGTSATVTYTPNQDFVGTDQFGFQASDGTRTASGTATVNIVNTAPTAFGTQVQWPSTGGSVTFTLDATDPEDDPLTFEVVSNPGEGTLGGLSVVAIALAEGAASVTADDGATLEVGPVEPVGELQQMQVTYTPNPNADPSDAFSFRVNDGLLSSTAANVQVTRNRLPAPQAVDQTGFKNGPIPVVLNATDPDGTPVTFQIVMPPAVGTFSNLLSTGPSSAQVTYTPPTDFTGNVNFTFRASDGIETADAAGTIRVIDRTPIANDVNVTTTPGVPVTVTLSGMDPDNDPLTFEITDPPTGGTLGPIVQQTPTTATVVYTPAPTTPGDDFRYRIVAGSEVSEKARVSIQISNSKPVADDQLVQVRTGQPRVIVLTGSDGDGDALTFAIDTPPANGGLSPLAPLGPTSASVTYTPNGGYEGPDSFTFTVTDGIQVSTPGSVGLTISNDPPTADPQALSVDVDISLSILLTGSDPDGDPLTFAIVSPPPGGTLGPITQVSPTSARVAYVPSVTELGSQPFSFTVNDGTETSAPAIVDITVNAIPEETSFQTAAHVELFAGGGFVLPGTPNIAVPQNALSGSPGLTIATVGTQPTAAGGVVVLESDGDFHYRPPAGVAGAGSDSFTFTTTSGRTATVTFDIFGVPTWFVNNLAPGPGTGMSWDPFSDLGSAESISLAGDITFLYEGDGTTTGYATGFTLKSMQALMGEAAGHSVAPFGFLVPPGGRPLMTNTAGDGVTLAAASSIRGFDIAPTVTGNAIAAGAVSGSTITDIDILGGGAHGLALLGSTGTFAVTDLDIDGLSGSPLHVDGGDPTLTVGLSGNEWTNGAGRMATIMNTTGGAVTLSGGTLTGTGTGIRVDANAGSVDFDLPVSVTSSSARPVELTSSTGAITFADLTAGSTGFTGIHGVGLTSLTVTTGTVSTTSGLGIDLSTSGLDITLSSVTATNGGGMGARFASNSGTAVVGTADLTSTGGTGLLLDTNSATFTFTTLDITSTTATALRAVANTGAVDLGTVSIGTTTGVGLSALGNGTISNTTGTIAATGARAIDIETTDMGLTFTSVSTTNPAGGGARFVTNTGTAELGNLSLTVTDGTALLASSGGTLSASNPASTLNALRGPAIDLTSTSLTADFASTTSTSSPAQGFRLVGHSGTLTSAGGESNLTTGTTFDIDGGAGTIDLDVDASNFSSRLISIQNRTGGSVTLRGFVSDTGNGILVSSNTPGSLVTLMTSGPITPSSGIGLDAVSGGTLTMTNGMRFTTTGATAVRIDGTTIGAGGVLVGRASADGATNGVFLRNTGTTGAFRINGNGSPASGGVIQNSTGDGIVIEGVTNALFEFMDIRDGLADGVDITTSSDIRFEDSNIADNLGNGVRATTLDGFELSETTIIGNGDAAGEHGVFVTELHGTSLFSKSTISGSAASNLLVSNSTTSGAGLDVLTVQETTFGAPAGIEAADNLSFLATGAADLDVNMVAAPSINSVTGGVDGIAGSATAGANLEIEVIETAVSGTTGRGLFMEAMDPTTRMEAKVAANSGAAAWSALGGGGIRLLSSGGADFEGFITGNSISGIAAGDGISAELTGDGASVLRATANTVDAVATGFGILMETGGGAGVLDLTMENNDVTAMGAGALDGLVIRSGTGAGGEANTLCLNLVAHDGVGVGGLGSDSFRLEQFAGTTFQLQDFAGDGTMAADVETWVKDVKANKPGVISSVIASSFTAAPGACVVPTI